MRTPGRGRLRAARGAALAAACLGLPVVAHVVAGGHAPSPGPFLLAAALFSTACVALAARRLGAGQVVALVLLSQPVLHVLLTLSGHQDDAWAVDSAMAAWHAAAAVVVGCLLAGAESVVWSLWALSATLLLRRARSLVTGSLVDARTVVIEGHPDLDVTPTFGLIVARAEPRRGPPAPACC